jgi:hypothetical protein
MRQTGTVEEYMEQFERVRSKLVLEKRQFSEIVFIDAFISGLKSEINLLSRHLSLKFWRLHLSMFTVNGECNRLPVQTY